jgi:hypothetical protein
MLLPYFIAGFVTAVRRAPEWKNKSPMKIGRDVTKITRSLINEQHSGR